MGGYPITWKAGDSGVRQKSQIAAAQSWVRGGLAAYNQELAYTS